MSDLVEAMAPTALSARTYRYICDQVRRDARLLYVRVHGSEGIPHFAVPARPLRRDELFIWNGEYRPRYLIDRQPWTYGPEEQAHGDSSKA